MCRAGRCRPTHALLGAWVPPVLRHPAIPSPRSSLRPALGDTQLQAYCCKYTVAAMLEPK